MRRPSHISIWEDSDRPSAPRISNRDKAYEAAEKGSKDAEKYFLAHYYEKVGGAPNPMPTTFVQAGMSYSNILEKRYPHGIDQNFDELIRLLLLNRGTRVAEKIIHDKSF